MLATILTSAGLPALITLASAANPDWQTTFKPSERLDGSVHYMLNHDDGSGPSLFVGGSFQTAGGKACNHIARWDGATWHPLGSGTNGEIDGFAVFDDGTGPALYAGGHFTMAGGVPCNNVARWDGVSWTPLGIGANDYVSALTVFDDGSGPALYAAGKFTKAGGARSIAVAKWNGTKWSKVGDEIYGWGFSLQVYDDGTGPALYAGGTMIHPLQPDIHGICKLVGNTWQPVGAELSGGVSHMAVFDDGNGPMLYAGGWLNSRPTAPREFERVARFNGTQWLPLGPHPTGPFGTSVAALHVFDDGAGSGPKLYVAGSFTHAGSLAANRIMCWDGKKYEAMGPGLNAMAFALESYTGPDGVPSLYVGGQFTDSGSGDAFLSVWSQ